MIPVMALCFFGMPKYFQLGEEKKYETQTVIPFSPCRVNSFGMWGSASIWL
jgi:hypothetical protein